MTVQWIVQCTVTDMNTWLKDLILINFVKKIRLAASPLPGVDIGGEHASGGPLRGG